MNSIFFRSFISIITAILIFILLIVFVQIYGFVNSIKEWEKERVENIKLSVEKTLDDLYSTENIISEELLARQLQQVLPGNSFVTIYDKDKNPLFRIQKRGLGRQQRNFQKEEIISSKMMPVNSKNELLMYFTVHILSYKNDSENQKLFNSIRINFIAGILISFVIAVLFALFFSKSLSRQSKNVANGIDILAQGNLDVKIDDKGVKEISLIAKSANILKEKLKKEKELRDQWALDIAHDLRTPVTAIKMQLEGILDKVLKFSNERGGKILKELNKIEYLINDLAELTILESPELKLKISEIDINKLFKDIESTFRQMIDQKKIDFKIISNVNKIKGDYNLLNRAFSNVINNAIKYSKKNGIVSVNYFNKDNYFIIEIFNSSSFISKNEINKIFDRLYRGDQARNTPGSGLGLTITKKIIELHNGKIKVKSVKNFGTTFIITIP